MFENIHYGSFDGIKKLCSDHDNLSCYLKSINREEKEHIRLNLGTYLIEISITDNIQSYLVLESDNYICDSMLSVNNVALTLSYAQTYDSKEIIFYLLYEKLVDKPEIITSIDLKNLFEKRDLWLELSRQII